jgi:hypothetical protein
MARAPSRRFGFVKLPGKAKRWRNESNPDFPIGAEISDRAMSGLSRSLRFAGQTVSKERYAKGVESGAFTYHPKTIRRLEALQFRRAMIDRLAPQMTTSERAAFYEWKRLTDAGDPHPAAQGGSLHRRFKKIFAKYEAFGEADALRQILGSTPRDVGAFPFRVAA